MEQAGYEKDSLRGPPGHEAPAGPPAYGAVQQPPPPPQYFPSAPGHGLPGMGGYPQMNPRYQGYSPLYNEESRAPLDVGFTHTTIIAPVLLHSEPDYLGCSIFNLLCCCLPLGIVALIYSLKTQDCNARGDGVGARQNSRTALTLNRVATGLGIAFVIIYVLCVIFFVIVNNQHTYPTIFPPSDNFGN